jgi:hypothetical protein
VRCITPRCAPHRLFGSRASVHRRFHTNPENLRHWSLEQLDIPARGRRVEVGCGPGAIGLGEWGTFQPPGTSPVLSPGGRLFAMTNGKNHMLQVRMRRSNLRLCRVSGRLSSAPSHFAARLPVTQKNASLSRHRLPTANGIAESKSHLEFRHKACAPAACTQARARSFARLPSADLEMTQPTCGRRL